MFRAIFTSGIYRHGCNYKRGNKGKKKETEIGREREIDRKIEREKELLYFEKREKENAI